MSSKSSKLKPQWKPNGYSALGPKGRAKVQANEEFFRERAAKKRHDAENARRLRLGLPLLPEKVVEEDDDKTKSETEAQEAMPAVV